MNILRQLYRFASSKYQNVFLDYKVDANPRYGSGKPPHAGLYAIINRNRNQYASLLSAMLVHKNVFACISTMAVGSDAVAPSYDNRFLSPLDMMSIYTILAKYKPSKYVEIGSGNSTKMAHKAKKDLSLLTSIISIDPMPRAEIDTLADRIIRQPFEQVDYNVVKELQAGDVLFVDNSHRILPNSDATVFFLEILPNLRSGVIVHIHDIFLPYDYPQEMCNRFYSEQYGLAIYLLAAPEKFTILLPNAFIFHDTELAANLLPIWEQREMINLPRHGGSFWLQIK